MHPYIGPGHQNYRENHPNYPGPSKVGDQIACFRDQRLKTGTDIDVIT